MSTFDDHGIWYIWREGDAPADAVRVEASTAEEAMHKFVRCERDNDSDLGTYVITCYPWREIRMFEASVQVHLKIRILHSDLPEKT